MTTDRVLRTVIEAALWARPWPAFGFDVLDTIELGYDAFGFDVVDVLDEGRERDIATRCTQCGEAWLMGPEALAAGKCWHCRANGVAS
jgi:hypothetical protein